MLADRFVEIGAALDRARLGARLALARTPEEVGRLVVEEVRSAVGAESAVFALPADDAAHLLLLAAGGLSPAVEAAYRTMRVDGSAPIAAVFREGDALFVEDEAAAHAEPGPPAPTPHSKAFVALAALAPRGPVGALALEFAGPRPFGPAERAALQDAARMVGSALDRTSLAEAERAARARLEALADAGARFLDAANDVGALVGEVARLVHRATGAPCLVHVPSSDGAGPGVSAVAHPDAAARAALAEAVAPAAGPLALPAATIFRPVVEEPLALLPRSLAAFVAAHPVHGVLVVPLRSEGRSIGAIAVFRHDRRVPLTRHDRLLVEALADRAATAVAYARLQASHEAAAARQALLADASRAFSEAQGDAPTLLEALVRRAAVSLGAACAVSLLAPDRASLVVNAFHHPDAAMRAALAEAARAPLAVGEGAIGRVVTTGKPLLVPRVDDGSRPAVPPERSGLLDACPPSTLLVVPLLVGGRVEGALSASRHDATAAAFDAADQALLEELADRAGIALAQAREHAELVRERARLAEVLERAESASRAKDEFLAMLSHELRNPLAPITTALRLLSSREQGRPSRERDVIERQVAHLVRLVDDLLDVSRVTRGKVRLEPRPVALPEIVSRAIETASPLLEARRHVLEVRVAPDLVLHADPHRLAQVIANLLSNAAKYTDPGGRIVLSAEAEGREARIAVTDNGIGLSPALLPHVFELFVQGERTLDRAPGGLGIGLTIVRSLVDLHGGRVTAESAGAGRGSTFTVWLPRAEGPPALRSAPSAPAASPGAASRVLVVDDNQDAAELLAEALRLDGHEVHVAFDGPSALAMAEQVHPRIALLDLGLPVMDGYELAGRLRASEAAIGLVAVTGYGQEMDRRASAQAGFAEHLVKPVDLQRVSQVVARLAGGVDAAAVTH